ncbi:MAG: D-TA family PLP-dependent enzyme, partial [Deltaproteobacteria bacterium]
LVELNASAKISILVDSLEGVLALKSIGARISNPLDVLLKVNTGLNRCGVEPGSEKGVEIIRTVLQYPFLKFKGLLTHAGHVYGAASKEEVKKIGREEGEILVDYAEHLRNQDIRVEEVSVGATPTVYHSAFVPGVTEIRPGNYVFFDAMQIFLGVVPIEKCSLSILSTVISRPVPNRIIIDAGSKALGLDKGAHGTGLLEGYGIITDLESRKKIPGLVLTRLSEEHGIIEAPRDNPLKLGDIIRIIPNHACSAINMYSHSLVLENGKITDRWELAARR